MTRPYKYWNLCPLPRPGDHVLHKRHGIGIVRGNWGTIQCTRGEAAYCADILDVIFTTQNGGKYLHCCRKEFLTIL